jgi:hypothetical protein
MHDVNKESFIFVPFLSILCFTFSKLILMFLLSFILTVPADATFRRRMLIAYLGLGRVRDTSTIHVLFKCQVVFMLVIFFAVRDGESVAGIARSSALIALFFFFFFPFPHAFYSLFSVSTF